LKKTVFSIIEKLDVFAQNRLKKWLQSPAHNQNADLLPFLNHFLQYKKVAQPAENETLREVYNLTGELARCVRAFLAHENQNEVQQQLAVAAQLYALDLAAQSHDAVQRAAEISEKSAFRNADWHSEQQQILTHSEKISEKMVRKTNETQVTALARHADITFVVTRLVLFVDTISYNNVLNLQLPTAGYTELLAYAKTVGVADEPLVALHIALLKCVAEENDEAHFQNLKRLLAAHYTLLNPTEQNDRYKVAFNYCVRKINQGKTDYFAELFDFYKTNLPKGILLQNNILQFWDYKNIIAVGLRQEEYAWVEHFLYEYNEKLPAEYRANALNYNLAKLSFAQKNYKKVIELLQIVEYQDLVYTLDSRTTLIKTYYELGEYEAMESAAESFRLFLLRNKTASTTVKKTYQNFIRFIKKIAQSADSQGGDIQTTAHKKLSATIDAAPLVADKKWLLLKLEKN
jgi:hypothetical protein